MLFWIMQHPYPQGRRSVDSSVKTGISFLNVWCEMMKYDRNVSFVLWIGLVFLLTIARSGYALKENIRFERLSITDGLSQNTVRDIFQDNMGFIWFATQDGLNRYDGHSFYQYRHNPDNPYSLSNNLVLCLAEDKAGALWIGTWNGGLNKLDRYTDRISHYRHDPNDSSSISDDDISVILPSRHSPNVLWIGTSSGGLNRFDTKTEKFIHYRHRSSDPNSLSSDRIKDLYEDAEGILWIGTQHGLDQMTVQSGRILRYSADTRMAAILLHREINCMYEDPLKGFWIGTDDGLFRLDRRRSHLEVYRYHVKNPESISNNRIMAVSVDSLGSLWVATWNGLNRFDPEKNNFVRFYNEPDNPKSLSYNSLYALFTDRSGILWIGSYSQGINLYDRNRNKFTLYRKDPRDSNSLSDNIIKALYEDRSGMLWIGTYFGGLCQFDRRKGVFRHFVHNPNLPNSLSSNSIICIYEDRSGLLWIATTDKGLNTYDRARGQFTCYRHNPDNPNSLSDDFVNAVFEDSKGRFWIGTRKGLNELDRKTQRFTLYRNDPHNPRSISNDRVKGIFEDSAGILWLVTDKGINRFDPENHTFTCYSHEPGNPNSLSHDIVVSIYESPHRPRILWISTYGGGLNKFDLNTSTFTCYREKDGLPNDMVYGILEDNSGNFWLSTDRGLSRFNPDQGTFKNYDICDGLLGNEFNLALCKTHDGMMFFGGMDGMNAFHPDHMYDDTYIPPIVLTDLKIFNRSVPFGQKLNGRVVLKSMITAAEEIELSHKDYVFSFEFAALSFSIPQKSQYAYKMEGVDADWIKTDADRRHATYTNLAGGNYLFRVRGTNSAGIWNESGASVRVRLRPPVWQTTWFRVLMGFGIFSLALIIYRVRSKNIEDQKKNLELMVRQRTEDIKQQAEELEALDRIVNLINREFVLDRVFDLLLRQGMKLQKKAEKAVLLIFDQEQECFTAAAVFGYEPDVFKDTCFTQEEILGLYSSQSEEIEKNIYIIRDFKYPANHDKLNKLPMAQSIMIMVITLKGKLEGFFVLENGSEAKAFDRADAKRLSRFRSHAISAIARGKILQDLREKNAEIIKAQEQLITQQKLASLGALTAGIAHEIKNPLNFVNNFAILNMEMVDELQQQLDNNKAHLSPESAVEIEDILNTLRQNAARIQEHGKRADSIVRSMLQHSRGKSGERQLVDINAMLEQDVNLAYHGMRAQDSSFNITIETELDRSIEKLEIVPQDISRVFLNIISNACYESHRRKMGQNKDFMPKLWVRSRNLEDRVEIRIRDNGHGVPAAIRDKLFMPFFTTKPTGQGTGLGLSISYDIIVHAHGGELTFESEVDHFTEFIIRLPKIRP